MAAPLRKRLTFHVLGQDAGVDVDYSLLETIERVFSVGALDVLIPAFSNPEGVQRRLIADVLADVLGRVDMKAFPRADVRMEVMTMDFTAYSAIVLQLCAAVSFSLKRATADEFERIIAGAQALKKKPAPQADTPADS
jgi:hypothetical protein